MITLSSCRDLFESAMGLCLSCCPRSSDTDSVGPDGDRSRLITDVHADNSNAWNTRDSDEEPVDLPNGSYSESYPIGSGIHFGTSLPKPKKNDEQAALNDIVHRLATDIIDVNMSHATQTLEAQDVQERAHEYGRKLQAVSSKLAHKYAHLKNSNKLDGKGGLADTDPKMMHTEVLNSNDSMLINEIAARAREASYVFQVEHVPNLVGQFGQIRRRSDINDTENVKDEEETSSHPVSEDDDEDEDEE